MKTRISVFFTFLMLLSSNFLRAQNDDELIRQRIKDFYIAYANNSSSSSELISPKLDEILKQYCSVKLRKDYIRVMRTDGFDLLIGDHGIEAKDMKTLTITKDPSKINTFVVSFLNNNLSPTGKPIVDKVILYVTTNKENGVYKISNVKY